MFLGMYLAKNHGVSVVGVSVSKEQIAYAQKASKGMPCTFRLADYRSLSQKKEKFHRVVSIGLAEHVGKHVCMLISVRPTVKFCNFVCRI